MCGLVLLFLGVTACLAYMFIDVERYEVARGYKALHNPVQGQELLGESRIVNNVVATLGVSTFLPFGQ